MNLLELQRLASRLYAAGDTVSLVGPPGCGKTQGIRDTIVKTLSLEYNTEFGFHDSLAPTLDAPDYKGFLVPTKDADGTPTSFFTRSPELPSKDYLAKHPRGIYLVDELSSAEMLTRKRWPQFSWRRNSAMRLFQLAGKFGQRAIVCQIEPV
jgi:MoxR-like ATPase